MYCQVECISVGVAPMPFYVKVLNGEHKDGRYYVNSNIHLDPGEQYYGILTMDAQYNADFIVV